MTPPTQSDADALRAAVIAALRAGAYDARIDADSDDRITREIAMGVSSALEKVADQLEGNAY